MNKDNLVKNVQYYCKAPLYRNVWFVEICDIGKHKGWAYVEWMNEDAVKCGWYVNPENLIENI